MEARALSTTVLVAVAVVHGADKGSMAPLPAVIAVLPVLAFLGVPRVAAQHVSGAGGAFSDRAASLTPTRRGVVSFVHAVTTPSNL